MKRTADSIGAEQVALIRSARAYVDECAARGVDVALEPECYLTAWARTRGNARLRRLAFGWRAEPQRLLARAKDAVSLAQMPAFLLAGTPPVPGAFDTAIVSWALPSDFDHQGGYTDRYVRLASKDTPRVLWFVLLLEGAVPRQLAPNVRVLHTSPNDGSARTMRLPRRWSRVVAQAHEIAEAIGVELRHAKVRRVVLPYEAQPFQNALTIAAKKQDPAIVTIGYVHSALPALPTDFLYRAGAPDQLLVHGHGQGEILRAHLGWPAERLTTIPSLRYLRERAPQFAGRILLPYSFDDPESIERRLEAYMRAAPAASMPCWDVRIHPVMAADPRHLELASRLKATAVRHADRMSPSPEVARQTLIFGATAAVIEALERGLDVVHVCNMPLFEKHSAQIWTLLEVEELATNVYRYRLREPGAYIRLGTSAAAAAQLLEVFTPQGIC